MPKYIASYGLGYEHAVTVGVVADNPEMAEERVRNAIDQGTLWDEDASGLLLLHDNYEEHDDNVLDIKIEKVGDFPAPDASAAALWKTEHALALARKIASLKKWGEPDPDNDGEPFEPSDGLDDSHSCLMDLIDEARNVVKDELDRVAEHQRRTSTDKDKAEPLAAFRQPLREEEVIGALNLSDEEWDQLPDRIRQFMANSVSAMQMAHNLLCNNADGLSTIDHPDLVNAVIDSIQDAIPSLLAHGPTNHQQLKEKNTQHEALLAQCRTGAACAQAVIDAWETGDLAGAVNTLEEWMNDTNEQLTNIDRQAELRVRDAIPSP